MRDDVIELVVTLGDTTIEHRFVELDAKLDFDRATLTTEWVSRKRGLAEIAARRVPRPRKHALGDRVADRRSLGYIAVSLAVHLVVWNVATEQPPDPTVRIEPVRRIGIRYASALAVRGAPARTEPDNAKTYGIEARGDKPTQGLATRGGRRTETISKQEAIEAARASGVLGSAALANIAQVGGTVGLSAALDHASLASGTTVGFGNGKLGVNGIGQGGVVASGRYQTIGSGRGTGEGWGGELAGREGGRGRGGIMVIPCAGPSPCYTALGGLDKAVVRRYIQRQLSKFQYCYEKELLVNDQLAGTVDTRFLITPEGDVMAVEASGVSPEVSTCVAGVIKNIQFPRSRDGSTEVRYPFTFRTAGS